VDQSGSLSVKIKFSGILIANTIDWLLNIGDGTYSTVYKVKRKEDDQIYALK
jgi:hypothetical protein